MSYPNHDPKHRQMATMLIDLRKKKGLHQQQLAELMNRQQSFVSRYESGTRRLDVFELLEILEALGAEPHEFIDQIMKIESRE